MIFWLAVLRQASRNLRLGWASQCMTLATVSLSVVIFSFFYLVYDNMLQVGRHLTDNLCVIAYLENEPTVGLQEQYRKRILEFDEVERIVFVSPMQARQRFAEQLREEQDLLDDMPEDFLPPSMEITPRRSLEALGHLKRFSDHIRSLPGVLKVRYGEEWLDRFHGFVGVLRVVVLLSGLLLVLTAVHMVSHTIRITMVRRQEEFELQHLLGASRAYLSLPFLLESLLQGLLGSGIGLGALFFLHQWIRRQLFNPVLADQPALGFLPAPVLVTILASATLLCLLGGLLSLKRFLRR